MKKYMLALFAAIAPLAAAPKAVVFDWGNVIAFNDRSVVVDFLCESLHLSKEEFEEANLEKRKAMALGKSDVEFWTEFASKREIVLESDWPLLYQAVLKKSIGVDPQMTALIDELKDKEVRVGLLSNIDDRYTQLIREFGFYEPYNPCLLSCEIGVQKPDPQSYEALLKATDLPPAEIVFIDDKQENVEAAQTMGIDAILFESADQIRQELVQRGLFQ